MKKLFTKIVTFMLSFCLIGTAGITVKADSDPNVHEHTGMRTFVEYLDENGNFTKVIWYVCDECNEFVYVCSDTITPKEYYEREKENLVSEEYPEDEFNKGLNYQVVDGQASIDIYGTAIPIWTEEFFSEKTVTLTVPEDYALVFTNSLGGRPDGYGEECVERFGSEPAKISVVSDEHSLLYEAGYDTVSGSLYQKISIDGEESTKAPSDFIMEKIPSGTYTITVNDNMLKTEYLTPSSLHMGRLLKSGETAGQYFREGDIVAHVTWNTVESDATAPDEDKTEDATETDSKENTETNNESESAEKDSEVEEKSEITLSGVLKDKDGNPIANAVIELHSDPITVKTDNNGYWEIKNPPVGDHTLTAYVAGKAVYQSEIAVSKEKISETVKVKDETVAMSVKAEVASKVPSLKMGDSNHHEMLITVTMLGIVLITLGCYILISKKKKAPTK